MLLTSPPILQFKSLSLSTPFLHGAISTTNTNLFKPSTTSATRPPSSVVVPVIKAMRSLQGKVVCSTSDKTVAVEVVRLAPHPKYKRRVRKKKKYQAHDPLNQFKVGDLVQLEKGRPISKNKTFWAVPVPPRSGGKPKEGAVVEPPKELGIPLESQI
ncbi:40S ribosomal protein S17 [Castilleja foliolosa]|uniref:Small ribosomal subunit protein uS17c n=1 Tax=Castilleja foliolosa TaxID=1961234 RepID=A0ABD3CQU3_9LAMI